MSVRTLTEYPPPDWSSLWARNWNAEEFVGIQGLTTTQRDELIAYDGMIIYNKTTNEFQGFKNGNWEVFGGGGGGGNLAFDGQYVNCTGGTGSAAGGNNCVASGDNSFAMGNGCSAVGNYSAAIGALNQAVGVGSVSIGVQCTADGQGTIVEGNSCSATGHFNHAEGNNCHVTGTGSHIEGNDNSCTGDFNHVEGNTNVVTASGSHVEGAGNNVNIGGTNHIEGSSIILNNQGISSCHIEGNDHNSGTGIYTCCHIEGRNHNLNVDNGIKIYCHMEGSENSLASNPSFSHVEGFQNTVSGNYSHAQGYKNIVSGNYSHAQNYQNTVSGNYSHAEGVLNTASASYSHVGGSNCSALANGAFCHGWEAIADGLNSFSLGMNTHSAAQASYATGRFTKANNQGVWIHGYYGSSATGTNDGTTGIAGNGGEFSFQLAGGSSAATNPGDGISVILRTALFGTPQPIGEIITDYFTVAGADYAEYFEWEDGNPNNEDRVGYFVELTVDGKIGIAKNSKHVIGIVSAAPSIVGDSASRFWDKTILRDDFGRPIITTLPDGRKTTTVNPNYDPTKQYIPRSERKEWAPIGLLGKLCVRDDASCHPGCYCSCENGIAVHKQCKTSNVGNDCRWKVIKRISKNVVQILYTFK